MDIPLKNYECYLYRLPTWHHGGEEISRYQNLGAILEAFIILMVLSVVQTTIYP